MIMVVMWKMNTTTTPPSMAVRLPGDQLDLENNKEEILSHTN